jgi:hypothetical protein
VLAQLCRLVAGEREGFASTCSGLRTPPPAPE